jgi:hypothetical protein
MGQRASHDPIMHGSAGSSGLWDWRATRFGRGQRFVSIGLRGPAVFFRVVWMGVSGVGGGRSQNEAIQNENEATESHLKAI